MGTITVGYRSKKPGGVYNPDARGLGFSASHGRHYQCNPFIHSIHFLSPLLFCVHLSSYWIDRSVKTPDDVLKIWGDRKPPPVQ
jgi:hypothetical protein